MTGAHGFCAYSEIVDVYDRLCKCLGRLLRQIVPDTGGLVPGRLLAGEFPGTRNWHPGAVRHLLRLREKKGHSGNSNNRKGVFPIRRI